MNSTPRKFIILMADDDADDRLLAKDALAECAGASDLKCVENGEELLEYLQRRGRYSDPEQAPRPGLILLDLNMPKKDGRDALREIKLDPELRKIPVVVLTTSRADTDISRIYDLGANSFIAKPVSFDSLVGVMKLLVRYWFEMVELPTRKA
jgi:CheY-like chemotaxis protein